MRMSLDPSEAMFLVQNFKANNQKEPGARYKDMKRERAREREKKFKLLPHTHENATIY